MSDQKIKELEEKISRLENKLNNIYRSRTGLSVDPALNTLGQDTKINGDLDITGSYLVNGTPLTSGDPMALYLDGSRTMTGNLLNTSSAIVVGYGTDGETTLLGHGNGAIEIGKAGRSVAGTPFIDFHSSQNSPDYDARIIASGGSSAGSQQGTLNLLGASILKNNASILSLGASEIANTTEKTAIEANDLFLIEDSANSNAKKRVKQINVDPYRPFSVTFGDGVNNIPLNSSMRLPVPFDMTLIYWFFNTSVGVTSLTAKMRYYNGTAWIDPVFSLSAYTGTNTGGSLSQACEKHSTASQRLLEFWITGGTAKTATFTLLALKTGNF